MPIFMLISLILWLILFVFWIVSAFSAKKTVQAGAWWRRMITIRIVFIVIVFILFKIGTFSPGGILSFYKSVAVVPASPWLGLIGIICCAAGVAFAIWARIYLGKNWGMPMTLRVNPELVTSGPYKFVRHPIYTGILLTMFGSIFTDGTPWVVALIFFGIYFIYSAKMEEKTMTKEFPNEYPAYMRRSKMLIPFIL